MVLHIDHDTTSSALLGASCFFSFFFSSGGGGIDLTRTLCPLRWLSTLTAPVTAVLDIVSWSIYSIIVLALAVDADCSGDRCFIYNIMVYI